MGLLLETFNVLNYSNTDIAATFFLDDIPSASIPGSRLRGILERTNARQPLTVLQQDFLRQHGYESLLQFALGKLEMEGFRIRAQGEREGRLTAKFAAVEVTNRKNASHFAERDTKLKRRRKLRELPDRFGLPFIHSEDFGRVNHILRAVAGGQPLEKDDLVWLGSERQDYWTYELRKAHHVNTARKFSAEWKQTGVAWAAINACGHFRKDERSLEGLVIAEFLTKMGELQYADLIRRDVEERRERSLRLDGNQ